jgi:hypothetical protein
VYPDPDPDRGHVTGGYLVGFRTYPPMNVVKIIETMTYRNLRLIYTAHILMDGLLPQFALLAAKLCL